jgi:hypothetical protein
LDHETNHDFFNARSDQAARQSRNTQGHQARPTHSHLHQRWIGEGEIVRTTAEILREIAEDYLHLAQDADGKVDATRRKKYQWLLKLSNKLRKEKP